MTATNWKNHCRLNVVILLRFKLFQKTFGDIQTLLKGVTPNKFDNVLKGRFYFGDRIKIVNTYDVTSALLKSHDFALSSMKYRDMRDDGKT